MVETKKFNPQLIRKKIEDFFTSSGIPVNHFFSNNSCLVAEEKLVNYSTRETVNAFSVVPTHPFSSAFEHYLENKYSFNSKFKDLLISYEAFFNRNTMPFYSEAVFYLIDNDEKLRCVRVFEFDWSISDKQYMLIFEFDDSDVLAFEQKLLDYYIINFYNGDFPDELRKPLKELTPEELTLLNMISI